MCVLSQWDRRMLIRYTHVCTCTCSLNETFMLLKKLDKRLINVFGHAGGVTTDINATCRLLQHHVQHLKQHTRIEKVDFRQFSTTLTLASINKLQMSNKNGEPCSRSACDCKHKASIMQSCQARNMQKTRDRWKRQLSIPFSSSNRPTCWACNLILSCT